MTTFCAAENMPTFKNFPVEISCCDSRLVTGGCGAACGQRWDGGEQVDEAGRDGRVGDDERSNRRVGQVGGHCQLYDRKKLAAACAEGGEAEDAIVFRDQDLDEAARLREGKGAQIRDHGDFSEAVGDSMMFCLVLRQAYVGQLRVDE